MCHLAILVAPSPQFFRKGSITLESLAHSLCDPNLLIKIALVVATQHLTMIRKRISSALKSICDSLFSALIFDIVKLRH